MKASVTSLAIAVILITGCSTAPVGTATPNTVPAGVPTASPAPTASPEPPTASPSPVPSFPEPTLIEPAAVIDIAGTSGAISVASDGQTVWAVDDGELLRIDAQTNAIQRLEAPVQLNDTTLTIADDGLWVTRWSGNRLYRLDPVTGEVRLEVMVRAAVRVAFVGQDLWVGREDVGAMFKVDRLTGAIGSLPVRRGGYGVAGLGDLWFAGIGRVIRIDPATGEKTATIEYPGGETNCGITGAFPDNAWTSCFEPDVVARSVARIDPATNTVAAVAQLPATHGGAFVIIKGQPWFVGSFLGSDGQPFAGLLRIDPDTGGIDRFLALAGSDPDAAVVSDDALWVPDEPGRRVLKVDFADLID